MTQHHIEGCPNQGGFRIEPTPRDDRPIGLCLGFFDGVHLGHQELLHRLRSRCQAEGWVPSVYTFDRRPHGDPLSQIQTNEERLKTLEEMGVERVYLQSFTPDFAHLSGEIFLETLLFQTLNVQLVVVGYDFRFGHQMKAGIELLRKWCANREIPLEVVEPVCLDGQAVHSTGIREAIEAGDFMRATTYLGRPYSLGGVVVHGNGLGHRMGFPTANFRLDEPRLYPPPGVYRTWARVGNARYASVSSVGYRPTVVEAEKVLQLETFLLEYEGNLYGQTLQVEFVERFRPEFTFPSLQALEEQVHHDIERARQLTPALERLVLWDQVGDIPVYLLPVNRFRVGEGRLLFHLPHDEGSARRAAALQYVVEATRQFPKSEKLQQELLRLYGASLWDEVSRIGRVQELAIAFSGLLVAPDRKRQEGIECGLSQPEDLFALLLDLALRLPTEGVCVDETGEWELSRLRVNQQQVLDEWAELPHDPGQWAWVSGIQAAYSGRTEGRPAAGSESDWAELPLETIQNTWKRVLTQSNPALYLALPPSEGLREQVKKALEPLATLRTQYRELVASQGEAQDPVPLQWSVRPPALRVDPLQHPVSGLQQSRWVEVLAWPFAQTPLVRTVASLLHTVLGGDSDSLLFEEIREKRGLAYEVSSIPLWDRQALAVQGGIHPGSEDEARQVLQTLLKRLRTEGPDPEDWMRAKRALNIHLREIKDSLSSFFSWSIRQHQARSGWTAEGLAEWVLTVPVEQGKLVAQDLETACVFWLLPESISEKLPTEVQLGERTAEEKGGLVNAPSF